MAVPRLRVPPATPPGTTLRQASDEVELYHRTYTTLLRSSGETLLRVLEPSHAAMGSSLHALAHDMEAPDLGAFLYALRRLPAMIWKSNVIVVGQESEAFARAGVGPDRGLGAARGARPAAPLVRLGPRHDGGPARLDLGPRRRDPDAGGLPARVEQAARAAARRGAAAGSGAARRRRGRRRDRGGLDPPARVLARRAGRVRERGPRAQAQLAPADARRLAVRLRAADAPLVGADPDEADRPGPLGPADVLRLLEPALDREPHDHEGGRERDRDRGLRRVPGPGLPQRGARALPHRAHRGLVGELPLLRARGCTTRASPTTARPGSAAARTSASSASRTSPRAAACASAPR